MIDLTVKEAWYTRNRPVVKGFSLAVPTGGTAVLTGPSGAGKTTLLSIMAGIHKQYEGALKTGGLTALIPQKACLPPFYTVYENTVLLGRVSGRAAGRKPDKERATRLLQGMGLSGFEGAYPETLSGGQYRRAALAQALYAEPDVLLLDEPFSALDEETKRGVMQLLAAARRQREMTVVMVTHSREEALAIGGQTVKLGE